MLNHAFEFIRIADAKPDGEKITRRSESATELAALVATKSNRETLLGCVQGAVNGFHAGFAQDSPAVAAILKAIKDRDPAFPNDLSENAEELRACAALALSELLATHASKGEALTAALAVRAATATRREAKEKHLKSALEKIAEAAGKLVATAAASRRQRSAAALRKLQNLEEPAEPTELWKTIMPVLRSTIREFYEQTAADREEIESLWWMFQGFSDVARKSLAQLSPAEIALCAGVELADRSLVPPMAAAGELVSRAVEQSEKDASKLVSLQDLVGAWDENMIRSMAPIDAPAHEASARYPALLPLTYACRVLGEAGAAGKLSKNYASVTGFAPTHTRRASDWGAQVFQERILQRVLTETSGS